MIRFFWFLAADLGAVTAALLAAYAVACRRGVAVVWGWRP